MTPGEVWTPELSPAEQNKPMVQGSPEHYWHMMYYQENGEYHPSAFKWDIDSEGKKWPNQQSVYFMSEESGVNPSFRGTLPWWEHPSVQDANLKTAGGLEQMWNRAFLGGITPLTEEEIARAIELDGSTSSSPETRAELEALYAKHYLGGGGDLALFSDSVAPRYQKSVWDGQDIATLSLPESPEDDQPVLDSNDGAWAEGLSEKDMSHEAHRPMLDNIHPESAFWDTHNPDGTLSAESEDT